MGRVPEEIRAVDVRPGYRTLPTRTTATRENAACPPYPLLEGIRKLKDQPVSDDELRVQKDGIIEAFPSQWATKQAIANRFADETREGWPEDWWASHREKIQAVTAADVQRMTRKLFDANRIVILAVGKAAEMEPGDPDHPGTLKEVAPLPLQELPLRDPATLKPMP